MEDIAEQNLGVCDWISQYIRHLSRLAGVSSPQVSGRLWSQ